MPAVPGNTNDADSDRELRQTFFAARGLWPMVVECHIYGRTRSLITCDASLVASRNRSLDHVDDCLRKLTPVDDDRCKLALVRAEIGVG